MFSCFAFKVPQIQGDVYRPTTSVETMKRQRPHSEMQGLFELRLPADPGSGVGNTVGRVRSPQEAPFATGGSKCS